MLLSTEQLTKAYGDDLVYKGGLRIYTTADARTAALTKIQRDGLSNLNLEKRVIRVFMTPLEIFLLVHRFHFLELAILLVLLSNVSVVGTIFLNVPCVIVFAFAIVVPLVVVGSTDRRRNKQGGAQQEPA